MWGAPRYRQGELGGPRLRVNPILLLPLCLGFPHRAEDLGGELGLWRELCVALG